MLSQHAEQSTIRRRMYPADKYFLVVQTSQKCQCKHCAQGKGSGEQSQTLHKGWEREIYGPCQITVLFPRSAFSLPPPTDPTLVSNATDPSIPYLTTAEDHLLSFLPCNLVAFYNSILEHMYTLKRAFPLPAGESVFGMGHSLRMGVISWALPGLSWEQHRCVALRWPTFHRKNCTEAAKIVQKRTSFLF